MPKLLALLAASLFAAAAVADDPKPEPGFAPLFNGKDLTGWKTKPKKGDAESLDGKAEAFGGRFKAADGVLTIDPKVKGDVVIETAKELAGDVTIRFEFRPGKGCNNDLFLRGTKFDLKAQDIKTLKEDEWNEFEIAVTGKKAEFKCNGEALKPQAVKADKGVFGIRAEFGPVQFRRLRVKDGA